MKQTLFEAEAILSVNTDKLFADLTAAAQRAKKQLQQTLGGITIPTIGSGGGGGGGGGGAGGSSNIYNVATTLARGQAAAGQYTAAIHRLKQAMESYNMSAIQQHRINNLIASIERQRDRAREARISSMDREAAAAEKTALAAAGGGASSRINPLATEMADIRRIRNAREHAEALTRVNALLGLQLTEKERIAALDLRQNIIQRAAYEQQSQLRTMQLNAGPTPAQRQRNAMIQNLSFGAQDFFTVMSMGGGMSRAFASASNNLGFMLSMLGTTSGAIAALGVTMGMVFLPKLVETAIGFRDMGDSAEDAANRLQKLQRDLVDTAKAYDDFRKMREAAQKPNARGELEEVGKSLQDQIDAQRAALAGKEKDTAAERIRLMNEALSAVGENAGYGLSVKIRQFGAGEISPAELKSFMENYGGEQAGIFAPLEDWMFGASKTVNEMLDRFDKWNAALEDAKEEINKLEAQLDFSNRLEEDRKKFEAATGAEDLPGLFKNIFNATGLGGYGNDSVIDNFLSSKGFDTKPETLAEQRADAIAAQKERERAAKKKADDERQLEMKELQKRLPAMQSLFQAMFPKEAEIENIKKQFADAFGANLTPQQQAMQDFMVGEVKDKRPSITGTFGGAEFASQLTNQLLQRDPMTRLTEFASKQTGLQEEIRDDMRKSRERLEELQLSPFGGP